MLKEHKFVIRIDGTKYPLVAGFTFTRDLKMMGAGFELKMTDPDLDMINAFNPNKECVLEIDDQVIAKVYFYAVDVDDSNGHVYTYYGRDSCGDLIDCSAQFSTGFEMSNVKLDTAIRDILTPYGMKLTVSGDVGAAFKKLAINPGETVFNFIDRVCKYRGLFPLSDGVGGLILTDVSNIPSSGSLIVGQNGNVISRTGRIDYSQRHSSVTILGQSAGADLLDASAQDITASKGVAYDTGVVRHRPLIMQAEKEGYDLDMQGRAEFEVRHRKFIGTDLTYTVPGWEASEGDLWLINTSVPVRDQWLNLSRDFLIKRVSLTREEKGTFSQISVAPAEAYDLPVHKQPEDNAVFGGLL